jgi:hypothetical protein
MATATENYALQGGGDDMFSTHTVTIEWSTVASRRKLEIFVSAGREEKAAKLWGTIEKNTACLEHMEAGRFSSGKGVGYFMIHRFAAELLKYCNPEPEVCLGTPVNYESVNLAKEKGQEVSGELAALHIYTLAGFNVTTPGHAVESRVSASKLKERLTPKITSWSQLHEVSL